TDHFLCGSVLEGQLDPEFELELEPGSQLAWLLFLFLRLRHNCNSQSADMAVDLGNPTQEPTLPGKAQAVAGRCQPGTGFRFRWIGRRHGRWQRSKCKPSRKRDHFRACL